MASADPASKKRKMDLPTSNADTARRGLVSVNKLDYTLQPDLSVAVMRANKQHYFAQNRYEPGAHMICISNSGAEYVRPDTSYFTFEVLNESVQTINNQVVPMDLQLGVGSAVNFFSDVVITSRSGDECERIQRIHKLSPILEKGTKSADYMSTCGRLAGFTLGSSSIPSSNGGTNLDDVVFYEANGVPQDKKLSQVITGTTLADQKTTKFVVPLACLSGLFRNFDRLLPSMFMSGLRFDFQLNGKDIPTYYNTLPTATNQIIKWSIVRPSIVLDSYQLTDSVMRVLNEEAALRGLEVVFRSYHNNNTSTESSELALEVRKAVSRAISIVTIVSDNDQNNAQYDNMQTLPWSVSEWQIRCGSLYFPQQSIRGATPYSTSLESYYHFMRANGKLSNGSPQMITYEQFLGAVSKSTGQPLSQAVRQSWGENADKYSLSYEELGFVSTNTWAISAVGVLTITTGVVPNFTNVFRVGDLISFPSAPNVVWRAKITSLTATTAQLEGFDLVQTLLFTLAQYPFVLIRPTHFPEREYTKSLCAVWMDLERSNVQKLTGIPINNSRVLEIRMKFGTEVGADGTTAATNVRRQVDSYLDYVRLLRVFLQNVEIEE